MYQRYLFRRLIGRIFKNTASTGSACAPSEFVSSVIARRLTYSHFKRFFEKLPRCAFTANMVRSYGTKQSDGSVPEWKDYFFLNSPEFDWEYLCDEKNADEIQRNIENRKGVGDIKTLHKLCSELKKENRPHMQDILRKQLIAAANEIPNTSHPDSPIGQESDARIVDTVGSMQVFDFEPKTAVDLGGRLGLLRTDNVTVATGTKTYYFKQDLAKLEQALVHYVIKCLLKHGFELVSVPDLLQPPVIEGCGFKTSGERTQVYKVDGGHSHGLCLAGTAEMSLAALFMNEELDCQKLPLKYAATSRCYRAETSGLDEEKGIYRVHQFTKVEMFVVSADDTSDEGNIILKELLAIEKHIFESLGLHFRILDMPTQELGSPAHRKFDMEAWMPGKSFWGEISSASNCTDYQSRRLNIKYRDQQGTLKPVTTVNGTACAVPRTVMAILENYQQKDGSVSIPEVLRPYFDNRQFFSKNEREKMSWIKAKKVKQ